MVLHEQAAGASLRLRAQVDVAAVGRRQADLVFGRSEASGFYAICYQPGYISLLKYKEGWKFLELDKIAPSLFAAGDHTLEADIRPNQVEVYLDGKGVCTFDAGSAAFPAGQWGVGCYDSHITFRNVSAQSFADDKPANAAVHASITASAPRTR